MTRTRFSNAFLYGVDFARSERPPSMASTSRSTLVGASFDGASFDVNPTHGGAPPKFPEHSSRRRTSARHGSTTPASPTPTSTSSQAGTTCRCSSARATPGSTAGKSKPAVCVKLDYTSFVTTVPVTTSNTICLTASCTGAAVETRNRTPSGPARSQCAGISVRVLREQRDLHPGRPNPRLRRRLGQLRLVNAHSREGGMKKERAASRRPVQRQRN